MNLSPEQKKKNWALFAVLAGVAAVLFVMSILRFGASGGVMN